MATNWQTAVSERQMGERRKFAASLSLDKAATWIVLVPVAFFFVYPLWKLIALSVQTEAGLGLRYFAEVLANARTWEAVGHTITAAGLSTLISIGLGVSLAWLCAYTDIRGKAAIHALALLPLLIPSYVMTLAWTQLAGPQGVLNRAASWLAGGPVELWNVYGLDGIVVVMGLTHYPLVYMLTLSVLYRIPKELEWAAHSSGASARTVFARVTLPLALPGIAGGGLLAFISTANRCLPSERRIDLSSALVWSTRLFRSNPHCSPVPASAITPSRTDRTAARAKALGPNPMTSS